jgi:hypothetical protein
MRSDEAVSDPPQYLLNSTQILDGEKVTAKSPRRRDGLSIASWVMIAA